MSIICSSAKWITDKENFERNHTREFLMKENSLQDMQTSSSTTNIEVDWLKDYEKSYNDLIFENEINEYRNKLNMVDKSVESLKSVSKNNFLCSKNNNVNWDHTIGSDDEDDFLIDGTKCECIPNDLDENSELDNAFANFYEPNLPITKVIYCSRTHTQLNQMINEFKKSPFYKNIRVVILASRQHLCINESVLKSKNLNIINEKCIEMKNKFKKNPSKTISSKRVKKIQTTCPFYRPGSFHELSSHILNNTVDIEELIDMAKKQQICPYYSSRNAIKLAQFIIVPYNSLLQSSTRSSLGLNLDNNIIIIDEAHNLIDNLLSIKSYSITFEQLEHIKSALIRYINKFKLLLKAQNLNYINELIDVVNLFYSLIQDKNSSKCDQHLVYRINDFLITYKLISFNFSNICNFIKLSKLDIKLNGFVLSLNQESKTMITTQINMLYNIMQSLMNCDKDGRIYIHFDHQQLNKSIIKYIHLNPLDIFKEIVSTCRSLILIGGTLEPMSDFIDLFEASQNMNINQLICDHVISSENVLPIIITKGPTNQELEFSYSSRDGNINLINELGKLIFNISVIVPDGLVVFFSSFDYMNICHEHFIKNGDYNRISSKKKIFIDNKNSSDQIFDSYSSSIKANNSSILMTVINGKLSEGINFSDKLGRCILIVGLPFSNNQNPELQERINYLDNNFKKGSGQLYFENICLRSVNQTIGRAIRHQNDYATIILADTRYQKSSVRDKLPNWLKPSINVFNQFGPMIPSICNFFKNMKQKYNQN